MPTQGPFFFSTSSVSASDQFSDPTIETPILKQNVVHLAANSGNKQTLAALMTQNKQQNAQLATAEDTMGNTPVHLATSSQVIHDLLKIKGTSRVSSS